MPRPDSLRLRPGLELRVEDGRHILHDPITGFARALDEPWERALPPLLDGTRDREALWRDLGRPDRARLAVGLKTLRYLRMTDDTDPAGLALIQAARRDPAALAANAPFVVPAAARFGCSACGLCCRSLSLGPLVPEDVERLRALPLEVLGDLGRPPLRRVRMEGFEDERVFYLNRHEDGACVFLGDRGQCRLHEHFGADAKPGLCRLFPYSVLPEPGGLRVVDTGECHSFGTSAFQGDPLAAQLAGSAELLRQTARDTPLLLYVVELGDGLAIDASYAGALERRVLRLLEAHVGAVGPALAAVKAAADRFRAAILEDDGAPEAVVAAFEHAPAAPAEGVDRAAGLRALARLLDAVARAAEAEAGQGPDPAAGGPASTVAHDAALCAKVAASACRAAAAGGAGAGVSAVELGPADARLRELLLRRIAGSELLAHGSVQAGVAALAVMLTLATVGARLTAAGAGRSRTEDADLDFGQTLALRALRSHGVRGAVQAARAVAELWANPVVL